MDEKGFRQFLRKSGKKEHVVEGLIGQVRAFEAYLENRQQSGVEAADEQHLRDYVHALAQAQVKERMRGLALYYGFVGNAILARLASEIREQEIDKTRQAFSLREFRDVNPSHIEKLEAHGIKSVEQMLAAGCTKRQRAALAEEAGIPEEAILELVKLSDLARLPGVKGIRARLYYDAGIDSIGKMASWDPEVLRVMVAEYVERTGFDGVPPLPKEVSSTIASARKLPKVVQE